MLVMAGFRETLVQGLLNVVNQDTALMIEKACESLMLKQITMRNY